MDAVEPRTTEALPTQFSPPIDESNARHRRRTGDIDAARQKAAANDASIEGHECCSPAWVATAQGRRFMTDRMRLRLISDMSQPASGRITVEQLGIFIACAEHGSFSAAARRLARTQSVVSQAIATLETQLGVALFDRSGRVPLLTPHGRTLLNEARSVVGRMDGLRSRARDLAGGQVRELSIVVDMLFPVDLLTTALQRFNESHPGTSVRLRREMLGAVVQPVVEGHCDLGVVGPQPELPDSLEQRPLLRMRYVAVASPRHALARHKSVLRRAQVEEHVQLVVSDRSDSTAGRDFNVHSQRTWRLGDLSIKHSLLRAGVGWGHMPEPLVERDLAQGLLKRLTVERELIAQPELEMRSIFRKAAPPGALASAFLEQLRAVVGQQRDEE